MKKTEIKAKEIPMPTCAALKKKTEISATASWNNSGKISKVNEGPKGAANHA